MDDLELMKHAKDYIDRMANGINPLTGEFIAEDDFINNVRISRCLFYVSSVLDKVIQNGGEVGKRTTIKNKKKNDLEPFTITPEQLALFQFSETPITVSEITKRINALIDTEKYKKLSRKLVFKMLEDAGLIICEEHESWKKRYPTAEGEKIGISLAKNTSFSDKPVFYTVFDKNAQQFVLDNIYSCVE